MTPDDPLPDVPYEDPPEGYGDPLDEAARLQAVELLRLAVNGLRHASDREVLIACYGLDGDASLTVTEYASRAGISRREAYDRLRTALTRLTARLLRW